MTNPQNLHKKNHTKIKNKKIPESQLQKNDKPSKPTKRYLIR